MASRVSCVSSTSLRNLVVSFTGAGVKIALQPLRLRLACALLLLVGLGLLHSSHKAFDLQQSRSESRGCRLGGNSKPITTITTYGKEAPTPAESDCGHIILATLQGTLALFDNHWIRALWLFNQPVNWPQSFSSLSSPPIIEIKEHSDAPLNNSQHTAVTRMLSSSLNTCLTLIQGPPGTGKTTVIATY